MDKTQMIDTTIIKDIVLNADKIISETLTHLSDIDDIEKYSNASKEVLSQLESIGMIADISNLKGLSAVCVQLGKQFSDFPLSNKHEALIIKEYLLTWLKNIDFYLSDNQSHESIERLTGDLTEKFYSIRDILFADIDLLKNTDIPDNSADNIPDETYIDSEEPNSNIVTTNTSENNQIHDEIISSNNIGEFTTQHEDEATNDTTDILQQEEYSHNDDSESLISYNISDNNESISTEESVISEDSNISFTQNTDPDYEATENLTPHNIPDNNETTLSQESETAKDAADSFHQETDIDYDINNNGAIAATLNIFSVPGETKDNAIAPVLQYPEASTEIETKTETSFPVEEEISIDNNIDESLDIDIDEFDEMFAADDIDLESPEGIMAVLCNELSDLQNDISGLSQQVINPDKAIAETAATTYSDIICRIYKTSDELGLTGLVLICEFVLKNINLTHELTGEPLLKVQPLLQGWPQVIINHLQAPADDDLCIAVVDYLEDTAWPEPLKYTEIRGLINGLTKELELTGDYEVEARSIEAHADDVLLDIDKDTSQQLLDAFLAESPGYAEELTMYISNITDGTDVKENTQAAQRISHTLKGSANLIGCKGVANLAHHMEDIFEYLANQSLMPPEPLSYTMQEAADTIEVMIESLQGISPTPKDSQRILQDVLNWANRVDKGHLSRETDLALREPAAITNIDASLDATIDNSNTDPELNDEHKPATVVPSQTEYLRVPSETIDQVFNLIGETSIAIGQIQEQLKRMSERGEDMRKQEKTLQARRFELENMVSIRAMASQQQRSALKGNEDFDSLEMDQYDEFYGATHSFIEAVSDTRESSREVTTHIMELDGLFLQQQRLNRSLQNLIMTTRMVPVSTIAARLQRTVRQACRATGKQAELEIKGDQLLMDGNVLNQLADPLMHLLRNAIDHGIEKPELRAGMGKSAAGKISLHFYQEGNSIRVNCSDDGVGLDYAQIQHIALDRGLINPQEDIDNEKLARIILHSGFSTREKATQISGRGVGMDVVHTSILNLKGSIDIKDNQPSGTNFNLRLPITLLTSHSILVETNDLQFAIPTSMLEQILPPGTGTFSTMGSDLTFQLGKDLYPAISLAQLLGIPLPEDKTNIEKNIVLLVNFGSEIYAVMIEHVVSNYDLVVKNLGKYVKKVTGIAGVALLGNGGVVPVLDVVELLNARKQGNQQVIHRLNTPNEKSNLAKVLIVDDSLSVRKSLAQLVQDAGHEAILARDGIDALEIMQKTTPNLILTDLEMPRMTGLELATHVRANPDNNNMPIMMITSRTMAKHQEQAQRAGVNSYITKPFSEDDLVVKIGEALHG